MKQTQHRSTTPYHRFLFALIWLSLGICQAQDPANSPQDNLDTSNWQSWLKAVTEGNHARQRDLKLKMQLNEIDQLSRRPSGVREVSMGAFVALQRTFAQPSPSPFDFPQSREILSLLSNRLEEIKKAAGALRSELGSIDLVRQDHASIGRFRDGFKSFSQFEPGIRQALNDATTAAGALNSHELEELRRMTILKAQSLALATHLSILKDMEGLLLGACTPTIRALGKH